MKLRKTQKQEPVVRRRSEHSVSRNDIDPDALKVLYHLHRHGFVAYLVGGGVRDLLLGRKPKDFDVGTDAHPRQIKKIFRNAFLIGRRFRLAHIRFGTNIIETCTFRKEPEPVPGDEDDSLFQNHDNTFGTPEEDARRRDFTINGLFYDIGTFDVIDYVGGLRDLNQGVIRCIGDPDVRFKEDPVRMVRAVRFASRLGFKIEPRTYRAIVRNHREIANASPPRMLEEVYRLFGYQSSEAAFRLLQKTRLLSVMFPEIDAYVKKAGRAGSLLWRCLAAHDETMVAPGQTTPALMFGSMYCALFRRALDRAVAAGEVPVYVDTARELLEPCNARYRMPRKVYYRLVHMFGGQYRLDNPQQRFSKHKFLTQESFAETIELYGIYCKAAGLDAQRVRFWQELHRESSQPSRQHPVSRRRRRRRPPRTQ